MTNIDSGSNRSRLENRRGFRRESILATAVTMLENKRVAELGLNDLARHVGLAKSNVLYYFESREAVLLELHARECVAWLDDLEQGLLRAPTSGGRDDAIEVVAKMIAVSLAARPLFCKLQAASSDVLEHNVSPELAAAYRKAANSNSARLASLVSGRVGPFSNESATVFMAGMAVAVGGAWSLSHPSAAMLSAYRTHPNLRSPGMDFTVAVREMSATLIAGLIVRSRRVSLK